MGAWGHKVFEDDTSLDKLDELMESDDGLSMMEEAVKEALAADYLEYDQGHDISIAAAVIVFALGLQPEEMRDADIDGMEVWLETLSEQRLRALAPKVVEGIDLLLGAESELAELWAENETDYPLWRQELIDRKALLQEILPAA